MSEASDVQRMADQIRAAILSGELTNRLPPVRALAAQHGTSVASAGRVIELLRSEGLVVTRPGAGTYVRVFERITRSSPGRLARHHWGSGQAIQDADTGPRPRTVDVVVGEQTPPDDIADALGVDRGSPVLTRARRFRVDQRAVQLAVSYLPLDVVGGTRIAYTDAGPGGTYARLRELGHEPVRFTERLVARAPRPDEVDQLEIESSLGALVLDIERHAYDTAGRCVEVTRMILDATAYSLEYTFTA